MDSDYPAQFVHDNLVSHFGDNAVFFDVDSIPAGVNFHGILNEAVGKCDVLLAVIGDQWLNIKDDAGQRRIDDPDDFVRIEIEAALQRDISVIPVLVGRASVPRPEDLPSTLRGLARRQATEVRPGQDFRNHLDRLVRDIEKTLKLATQQDVEQLSVQSERVTSEKVKLGEDDLSVSQAKAARLAPTATGTTVGKLPIQMTDARMAVLLCIVHGDLRGPSKGGDCDLVVTLCCKNGWLRITKEEVYEAIRDLEEARIVVFDPGYRVSVYYKDSVEEQLALWLEKNQQISGLLRSSANRVG